MAKGKYQFWLTEEGLELLRGWKRNGLTDEEITDSRHMNISLSTFYEWKNKYLEISEALSRGREVVDLSVENALYKKTQGYNVPVKKVFKVKVTEYDPETGKKIREREEIQTAYEEVHVPADEKAQEFWLKNRSAVHWKAVPEAEESDQTRKAKEILLQGEIKDVID